MKFQKTYLLSLFLQLFICSCSTDTDYTPTLSPATLIYMVADNNLDYYAISNIKQMEIGLSENASGHIFVFIDRAAGTNPSHPYLLRITKDSGSTSVTSPILKVYREQNSCAPEFLCNVITDVKRYCKNYNAELRRMVLWSHGTGWLPEGAPFNELDYTNEIKNKKPDKNRTLSPSCSIGLDNTGGDGVIDYRKEMDIKDLAIALEGEHFELFIMDACFMGAVEVAYELRNVCDYLIMSPTEIVANGFPYEKIVNYLTEPTIDPLAIAVHFFNFYNEQKNALQSAAISIIQTRYLEELALNMENIYQDYILCRENISLQKFKQYDRSLSNYFFDYKDFILQISKFSENNYQYVLNLYEKVNPFYLHTQKMYGIFELSGTYGLSIYIPNTFFNRSDLHEHYKSLSWAQASGAMLLFD
jgi:hypothetical protein